MSFHYSDLWLIERHRLDQMIREADTLARVGVTAEAADRSREARKPSRSQNQKVAILPVHGPIEARASMFGELLGMTSAEAVGYAFDSLMADDSVVGVVLDIASPGGMVYGTPELANKIYNARGTKPIIAVANPMAASGAYWIAAAADRVIASPTADVGSVGVIIHHVDDSKAMERQGITETHIRSSGSPYKQDVSSGEPLTDEARDYLQSRADAIYEQFVGDLAKFRGLPVDHVRDTFGKGRLVDAQAAVKAGMVDKLDTLQGIVTKLANGRIRLSGAAAQDEWDMPTEMEAFRMRVSEKRDRLLAQVSN